MFWRKALFREALLVSAKGAATVFLSTVTSCALALVVESVANRTLFRFFPHLYDNVPCAVGLPHLKYRTHPQHNLETQDIIQNGQDYDKKQESTALDSITSFSFPWNVHHGKEEDSFTIESQLALHMNTDPRISSSIANSGSMMKPTQNLIEKKDRTTVGVFAIDWESYREKVLENINQERISKMVQSCAMTAG